MAQEILAAPGLKEAVMEQLKAVAGEERPWEQVGYEKIARTNGIVIRLQRYAPHSPLSRVCRVAWYDFFMHDRSILHASVKTDSESRGVVAMVPLVLGICCEAYPHFFAGLPLCGIG